MPIKPLSHLRFLSTTPPTRHTLSLTNTSLSLMKPHNTHTTSPCYRTTPHLLSRIFPFKLKYLCLSQPQHHRSFSTRPRQAGPGRARVVLKGSASGLGLGSGSDSGSKSLIEDEAELSDWVSELRTSSNLRGRVTSDEEDSESFGVRSKGRTRTSGGREREGDGFLAKRRRGEERGSFPRGDLKGKRGVGSELNNDGRRDWSRSERRGGIDTRGEERGSFPRGDLKGKRGVGSELNNDGRRDWSRSERRGGIDTRGEKGRELFLRRENQFGSDLDDDDEQEEEGYRLRRERRDSRGNVGKKDAMKEGKDCDLGLKSDEKSPLRQQRGFSDTDEGGFDDGNEREMLMKGIGDLLSEEESDDVDEIEDGDADIENNVSSSFGFKKEVRVTNATASPGKSDSYLSETR